MKYLIILALYWMIGIGIVAAEADRSGVKVETPAIIAFYWPAILSARIYQSAYASEVEE